MDRDSQIAIIRKIEFLIGCLPKDSGARIAFSGAVQDAYDNLFTGSGLSMEGRWQEACRELESMKAGGKNNEDTI